MLWSDFVPESVSLRRHETDAAEQVALRWRNLRRQLTQNGAGRDAGRGGSVQLPARVTDPLAEVQGDYSALQEALRRTDDNVAARAAAETDEALRALAREHGQGDLAATGAEATLSGYR